MNRPSDDTLWRLVRLGWISQATAEALWFAQRTPGRNVPAADGSHGESRGAEGVSGSQSQHPTHIKTMTATIDTKTNELVIRVPQINPPRLSSSGKTLLVASESGKTALQVGGKVVTVSLNAHIPAIP